MKKMVNQRIASITGHVLAANPDMPAPVAHQKATNTAVGIVLLLIGVLLFLAGLAMLILPMVLLKEHPNSWLIGFGALALLLGFYMSLSGARAMSDDVIQTDDAPKYIIALGKSIGFARGRMPKREEPSITSPDAGSED
jgi:succinate dehydrogenase hydrophobic anchor subunit